MKKKKRTVVNIVVKSDSGLVSPRWVRALLQSMLKAAGNGT